MGRVVFIVWLVLIGFSAFPVRSDAELEGKEDKYTTAYTYYIHGQVEEACSVAASSLQEDEGDPRLLELHLSCVLANNNLHEASLTLHKLIALDPDYCDYRARLGLILALTGQIQEAEKIVFDEMLTLQKNGIQMECMGLLAECVIVVYRSFLAANQPDIAWDKLVYYVENGIGASAADEYAMGLFSRQDLNLSYNYFMLAASTHPPTRALTSLANAAAAMVNLDFERAREPLLKCKALYDENPEPSMRPGAARCMRTLGGIYAQQDLFSDALSAFVTSIQMEPTIAPDHKVLFWRAFGETGYLQTLPLELASRNECRPCAHHSTDCVFDSLKCVELALHGQKGYKGDAQFRGVGGISVAFYCGQGRGPAWGPHSAGRGIGGSEEAVIFLSQQLAAQGANVVVYADIDVPSETSVNSVTWRHVRDFDAFSDTDNSVFVCWRTYENCFLGWRARRRLVWLHDIVMPYRLRPPVVSMLDGIFVLSKNEWRRVPPSLRHMAIVSANGLEGTQLVSGSHGEIDFIYASMPDRGLLPVLESWKEIRAALPNASLHVFYGFGKTWDRLYGGDAVMEAMKTRMMRLLKQDGIVYRGMVGQDVLNAAFASARFWIYPTMFPETSCITAMRAQAMGAVPITSRFLQSALPETAGVFDLGPSPYAGYYGENIVESEWLSLWVSRVIAAHKAGEDATVRDRMMSWARRAFSWGSVAAQWLRVFGGMLNPQKSASTPPSPPSLLPARVDLLIVLGPAGVANLVRGDDETASNRPRQVDSCVSCPDEQRPASGGAQGETSSNGGTELMLGEVSGVHQCGQCKAEGQRGCMFDTCEAVRHKHIQAPVPVDMWCDVVAATHPSKQTTITFLNLNLPERMRETVWGRCEARGVPRSRVSLAASSTAAHTVTADPGPLTIEPSAAADVLVCDGLETRVMDTPQQRQQQQLCVEYTDVPKVFGPLSNGVDADASITGALALFGTHSYKEYTDTVTLYVGQESPRYV